MGEEGHANPYIEENAKGLLSLFCRKYLEKELTDKDLWYDSEQYGEQYQATVTLKCLNREKYAGELASTETEAEFNAAGQALLALEPMIESWGQPEAEAEGEAEDSHEWHGDSYDGWDAWSGWSNQDWDGWSAGDVPSKRKLELPKGEPKLQLNTICMRLMRKPPHKGDIVYEAAQVPGRGWQATVTVRALPGAWSGKQWAGDFAADKKLAEMNAALQVLETIAETPELIPPEHSSTGPAAKRMKGQAAGVKGKGKDKMKGKDEGHGGQWGLKEMEAMLNMFKGNLGQGDTWKSGGSWKNDGGNSWQSSGGGWKDDGGSSWKNSGDSGEKSEHGSTENDKASSKKDFADQEALLRELKDLATLE